MPRAARRYLLLAGVILAGAVLASASRGPHATRRPQADARPTPRVQATAQITAAGVSEAQVPVGCDVVLTLRNQQSRVVALQLAGYKDRLGTIRVPPHGAVDVRFRADRPGEDFAWMQDGIPVGRFVVTGSHLEEGHR